MSPSSSSSSSISRPCAACKYLRRKCMANCVFAPQFPPDQSERFVSVHRVFGASNVSKILQDIDISQRNHAVDTLVYEAEARLQNPVYGPVAYIALLNETNQQIQHQLTLINRELSYYCNFLPPNPMHLSSVEQQQEQVRIEHQQQQHMMAMPIGQDQQQMLDGQMMVMHGLEQQPTQMTSVTNQRQMMMHDQQQQSLQTATMPMQRQMMMHVLQQQPSQMATVVGQRHMIVHEQQQQPPTRHQEIMMHGQHQQEQPPEMLEVAEQEQQQQQRSRNGAKRRLASS